MGEEVIMGDLFAGRGGWTKGFQAHGWDCWGIDLNPQPLYPGRFIQADIAHLIELPYADFYCCSSPCEQFSVQNMKHFHPNPKWPWLGSALFEYSRYLLEKTGKPYIMENVRAAEKFQGKAVQHCGPFYFWGNGVPAIFPRDVYAAKKAEGFHSKYQATAEMERRGIKREMFHVRSSLPQATRAGIMGEIPHEIAAYVASIQF